jgi:hypothetical protein
VALQADTNGDRKVDVIQTFANGAVARQDEDTNYDGQLDQSFVDGKPVPLPTDAAVPADALGALDCGRFSDFWKGR